MTIPNTLSISFLFMQFTRLSLDFMLGAVPVHIENLIGKCTKGEDTLSTRRNVFEACDVTIFRYEHNLTSFKNNFTL